jgi:hypothetical protein
MDRLRHGAAAFRGAIVPSMILSFFGLAVAGCFADPTEVVVVVDTDAKAGLDFLDVQLCFSSGAEAHADGTSLPVTVGARREGTTPMFDVLVKLNTTRTQCNNFNFNMTMATPPPFSSRKAMDVRFVEGEMRTLYLPMLKSCACVDAAGMPITNCAHALDPDCRDLSNPKLGDFDEDNLPHLPASAKSP